MSKLIVTHSCAGEVYLVDFTEAVVKPFIIIIIIDH